MIKIRENIILSEYTTIRLGGRAKYFVECNSESELNECIEQAGENNLRIQILGGGSNIIFPDEGFDGIVIKIDMKGISIKEEDENNIVLKVAAGEVWDDFVKYCLSRNFIGVECLAGIPGSVGATPIQNVGAYGQEVKDTIRNVKTIESQNLKTKIFSNKECKFDYRSSIFKNAVKNKYIITGIEFKLAKNKMPEIKYPELKRYIESKHNLDSNNPVDIMQCVLELRKKKSMILDDDDPNSISCGSFFTNPVITKYEYEKINSRYFKSHAANIPYYETQNGIKIPAAWLIENTGFQKGYKKNGIAVSEHHTLALINCGGKTKDLLNLADEIKEKVFEKFNITLNPEPVIVDN